jgi:hypothetical protein
MYSTCLFCNPALGANQVLERFPVGQRLAFDGATGRLWVVCRSCERWNLTPLEERWEIIESCEHLFSQTRLRTSTENIGLARLRDGLDLVRIGKPLRPEFAAWRYGDQFGRRRRKALIRAGAGAGAIGALVAGGAVAGITIGAFGGLFGTVLQRVVHGDPDAVVAHVRAGDRNVAIKRKRLSKVRLIETASEGWGVQIPDGKNTLALTHQDAERALALLMPPINRFGGKQTIVSEAVGLIERAGHPAAYMSEAASAAAKQDNAMLIKLPSSMRLALEMATHEEAERRALEGELMALENAWRQAEEIAAISDSLLTPSWIDQTISRFRRGG